MSDKMNNSKSYIHSHALLKIRWHRHSCLCEFKHRQECLCHRNRETRIFSTERHSHLSSIDCNPERNWFQPASVMLIIAVGGWFSLGTAHAASLWAGVAKVDITNRKVFPVND